MVVYIHWHYVQTVRLIQYIWMMAGYTLLNTNAKDRFVFKTILSSIFMMNEHYVNVYMIRHANNQTITHKINQ